MDLENIASTREKTVKYCYLVNIFLEDIKKEQYDILQKLYDVCCITNRQLVVQLHSHTFPFVSFDKAIYGDIAHIIIGHIIEDQAVNDIFVELMSQRYPKVLGRVRAVLDAYSESNKEGIEKYKSIIPYYIKTDHSEMTQEFRFLTYLIINSEFYEVYARILPEEIDNAVNWLSARRGLESELNDYKVKFGGIESEDGEPVYASPVYKKYLRKRKDALATYLGIVPEQLSSFFINAFDADLQEEDLTYEIPDGDAGVAYSNALAVVQGHYSPACWLQQITAPKSIRKESAGYKPNVEYLIDQYYKKIVYRKWADSWKHDEPFSKMTLSRECTTDPAKDYINILYMYQMDTMYQMFVVQQEELYRTFSWDSFAHSSQKARNEQIILNLKETIKTKDNTIDSLTRELLVWKESNQRSVDSKAIDNIQAFKKIEKELQEKDAETERLREQLRVQNEYIEALTEEKEDDGEISADPQKLHGKRFLFVGHINEAHPSLAHELRRNFPESVFIENLSDNLGGLQVDGIVYFITFVSHALYYKVRKDGCFNGIPYVYCRSCNADKVYAHMNYLIQD